MRDLGLAQYTQPLLSIGFDDMDTLLDIEDSDMRDLGLLPCHAAKLRLRLQQLRAPCSEAGAGPHEACPVTTFLKEAGLGQYVETLLRNGFDDLETLADMEDSDMKDLGIPRGHAMKLRKRLREYQTSSTSPALGGGGVPSDETKTAVARSWEHMQALGTYRVATLLYRHTFSMAPAVVDLFSLEVRIKYRDWTADEGEIDESNVYESPALRKLFSKVVNCIGCTVAGLHDISKLVPMLRQLGARHVSYGVHEAYFPIVGKALVCTLRECLGDSFTSEVEAAWTIVYSFMSGIMLEGLRAAKAAGSVSAALAPSQKKELGPSADDDCNSEDSRTTGTLSSGSAGFKRASSLDTEKTEEAEIDWMEGTYCI